MDTEEKRAPSPRDEAWRLIDLIKARAKHLGLKKSELARKAGVPLATVMQYFNKSAEPKLDRVLSLASAVGLEPREFFELAYPEKTSRTPARQEVDRLLRLFTFGYPPMLGEEEEEEEPEFAVNSEAVEEQASEEAGEGLEVGEGAGEGSTEEVPSEPEVSEAPEETP